MRRQATRSGGVIAVSTASWNTPAMTKVDRVPKAAVSVPPTTDPIVTTPTTLMRKAFLTRPKRAVGMARARSGSVAASAGDVPAAAGARAATATYVSEVELRIT